MDKKTTISIYCKTLRKKTGLSANAFAKSRGVSHTYIMNVESGKKDRPSVAVLNKLINVYNFSSEDLEKLDISPYIIDETINFYSVLHPLKTIRKGSYKSQIFDFIHKKLEPDGYYIEKTPIFDSSNKNYKKISIDKNGYLIPIYDFSGLNPKGNKFFAYIISPAHRSMIDDKYYEMVLFQMVNVANSIRYSNLKNTERNVELMFISFSAKVNEIVRKAKDVFDDNDFVIKTVPHFFNIKIKDIN